MKAQYSSKFNEEYNDFAELFELADINDEDIARDMNVDIQTVKSIKYEWEYEDAKDSPSLLFNRKRKPGVKSYYTRRS